MIHKKGVRMNPLTPPLRTPMPLASLNLSRRIAVAKYRLFCVVCSRLIDSQEVGSHRPVHCIYHGCSDGSAPHSPTGSVVELLAQTKSWLLFTRRRLELPCPNYMDHNLWITICTLLYTLSVSALNEKSHTRRIVHQVLLQEINTYLPLQKKLGGYVIGLMMPRLALRCVLPAFLKGFQHSKQTNVRCSSIFLPRVLL